MLLGNRDAPDIPGEEVREPAFGMRAYSVPEMFAEDLKREQFRLRRQHVGAAHALSRGHPQQPAAASVLQGHEGAARAAQDPEYRKLADEICTSHISYPGLQAVLKLLLAERVSIRNLHLIIEAIAEIAPHVRRTEQIVEHVRIRMAQQICGDLSENGVLKVLRLGNRWDLAFHQSLKRDAKGEVREFDIDPRQLEEFGQEATEGDPRASRRRRALRPRHRARRAALCAHDHRAAVPDAAGAVACRDRQGRRDPHARHDLVNATARRRRHRRVPRLLPHRRLLPADARPVERARADADPAVRGARRDRRPARPSLGPDLRRSSTARPAVLLPLIVSELLIGALIGLMARLYMLALQFIGVGDRHADRLWRHRRAGHRGGEPQAALASIISFSALLLLFVFDFHHEIIKALVAVLRRSRRSSVLFNPQAALVDVTDTMSESFMVMHPAGQPVHRLCASWSISAIGFVNKLVPQIPVYFISLPFVIAGGLIIFYFAIRTMLSLFADGFVDVTIGR